MQGYNASQLEEALGTLWELVEDRLTEDDYKKLGIDKESNAINGVFEELHSFGPNGPVGIGLGRFGGHAV